MQIIVNIKSVYGRETIYPVCETSKTFAQIAGTTTLTPETMRLIEKLNYRVLVQQPARSWAA